MKHNDEKYKKPALFLGLILVVFFVAFAVSDRRDLQRQAKVCAEYNLTHKGEEYDVISSQIKMGFGQAPMEYSDSYWETTAATDARRRHEIGVARESAINIVIGETRP